MTGAVGSGREVTGSVGVVCEGTGALGFGREVTGSVGVACDVTGVLGFGGRELTGAVGVVCDVAGAPELGVSLRALREESEHSAFQRVSVTQTRQNGNREVSSEIGIGRRRVTKAQCTPGVSRWLPD